MNQFYPRLFQPIRLGSIELKNRIIMGSMHTLLEEAEQGVTRLQAFYVERARAGVGLIISGGIAPNASAPTMEGGAVFNQPRQVRHHAEATRAVHDAGSHICLQLLHAGRYAFGQHLVAPSPLVAPNNQICPRELTSAEIKQTIIDFVQCAILAQKAGYDGVEIMGSEGYLLNEFIARRTNHRNDEWGGEYTNRIKMIVTIIKLIRKSVGPDFLIIYRLSMLDLVEEGSTFDEVIQLARAVAAAGVDVINTGIGWHEARIPTIASMVPRGGFAWVTAKLREHVDLPLVACNRINTPDIAEEILVSGMADLVSMARPLLADPEFVQKAEQGRSAEINTCIGCNQACLDNIFNLIPVSCLVNPRAGHETELNYLPTEQPLTIAVVGAGPAGLACASIAAQRGHRVTLFEAENRIGGQFNLAVKIPGKQEFQETVRYFEQQLRMHNVHVQLGRRVSSAELANGGFDRIVIATGVQPRIPALSGIEHSKVLSYLDVLNGKETGERVVIVGAGGIGVDLALLLSHNADDNSATNADQFIQKWGIDTTLSHPGGLHASPMVSPTPRHVSILQRKKTRMGAALGKTTGWIHMTELQQRGVSMHSGVEYCHIDDVGLHARIQGIPRLFPADSIIFCSGQESYNPLVSELKAHNVSPLVIGGALSTEKLDAKRAIAEGAKLAAHL